jgi:starvation-inducible DNA-binding protein
MRPINIGLTDEQREGVISMLNCDLADAYLLLIKTKKYHWDVVGPQFRSLHELWEEHYEALQISIDEIAERIRALGGFPLGTAADFLKHASIPEAPGELPTAYAMVENLVADHEKIIRNLRSHSHRSEEDFDDPVTQDFINGLAEEHEEMAWMLRSFIEGETMAPSGERPTEEKIPVSSK